ncbi:MAG: hypothetical protein ABEJ34_09060 [Haloferacaceae archaeon]
MERVPSDHPSVTSHRARVARYGGTRRPCVRLPEAVEAAAGETVRLVLAGDERHARVESDAEGRLLAGAYDNPRLAREREGENRLVAWLRDAGRGPGDGVVVDAVDGGPYGLRVPGNRVVYEATRGPDDSLAAIAERVERDRDGSGNA